MPFCRRPLEKEEGSIVEDSSLRARLEKAFARGSGHGLLQLGTGEADSALLPGLAWWRDFGTRYATALRTLPDLHEVKETDDQPVHIHVPLPSESVWLALVDEAPPMKGGEYLSADVLKGLWRNLDEALSVESSETGLSTLDFLKRRNPAWNFRQTRAFQSGREPQRRGLAVRFSRDLHHGPVGIQQVTH